LLDILIGESFSWDLLTEIKQTPQLAAVPVIAISTLDDAAKAKALGADEFAPKPIDRGWLIDTLDRLVKGEMRRRVLVIDDDEVFRYVIRQELAGDNVRVFEAATGTQGLETAKREKLDLIFLDLDLPDVPGYEVLSRLEGENGRSPPVVVISGMLLGTLERRRLERAAAIVPKSEVAQGRLQTVMADLAARTAGAAS
jgi:CheY-like chemotaxis protein